MMIRKRAKLLFGAAAAALLLSLGTTAGASAAPSHHYTLTISGHTISPDYDPVLVGECNFGVTTTILASYSSSKFGTINMRCGNSSYGYVHIRSNHQSQWQQIIDTYPIGGNWDDIMDFATSQSIHTPSSGYPKDERSNKWCYSAPLQIKDNGTVVKTYHPTIIISANNKWVITSFPTSTTPNCTGS